MRQKLSPVFFACVIAASMVLFPGQKSLAQIITPPPTVGAHFVSESALFEYAVSLMEPTLYCDDDPVTYPKFMEWLSYALVDIPCKAPKHHLNPDCVDDVRTRYVADLITSLNAWRHRQCDCREIYEDDPQKLGDCLSSADADLELCARRCVTLIECETCALKHPASRRVFYLVKNGECV